MVMTDVFPALLAKYPDLFAIPLTSIYNEITRTRIWPSVWKQEFVTPIPKKTLPQSANDLRNISCTALVSKIYESYVLQWLQEEIKIKQNQFGGKKGSSVEHLLCALWHEIGTSLEDQRAAAMVTAIDFAKAFNRLSYKHCLEALRKKGASSEVISLVATFLTNRRMRVKVDNHWSEEREVYGGGPQGSILGVILFNLTTEDLEEGSQVHQGDLMGGETGTGGKEPEDENHEEIIPQDNHPGMTSTPAEPRARALSLSVSAESPISKEARISAMISTHEGRSFRFREGAKNIRRRKLSFQAPTPSPVPQEPPTKKVNWKWIARLPRLFKFIADGTIVSKINMHNAQTETAPDTKEVRK